jgi:hypothetical protein
MGKSCIKAASWGVVIHAIDGESKHQRYTKKKSYMD